MHFLVKDQDSEVLNFKQALTYNIVTLTMIAAEGPPSRLPLHEASELLIGHRARSVAGGKVLGRESICWRHSTAAGCSFITAGSVLSPSIQQERGGVEDCG